MIKLERQNDQDEFGYFRASTTTTGVSDVIFLRPESISTTVAVYCDSRAYVEYTVSGKSDINSGNAEWQRWPKGRVSKNTHDGVLSVVTAVRAVSENGGDVTLEVVSK